MCHITNDLLIEIENEYSKWAEFFNIFLGVLSFTLGISCLGTPRPDVTGGISICFVFALLYNGQKQFPKTIKKLRDFKLEGVDELALIGIEKKYFSLKTFITTCPVFFFGLIFLGIVTCYGRFCI